jgi:hypothetical protein
MVFTYNLWNATITYDTAAPFGAYADLGNSNGNDVGFGLPLGPKDTLWMVGAWFYRGTDYGKLQLELATTTMDASSVGPYYGTISIADPSTPAATWYSPNTSFSHDGYSASPTWAFNWWSPFWLLGSDGTMLTADGTASAGERLVIAGTREFATGGGDESVYWWVRLRVNGKNGSSSGYKARIAGLQVVRFTGTGYPTS